MVVHTRQHEHDISLDDVKERVWKAAQDSTPNFAFDALIQLGVRSEMPLCAFEFLEERGRLIDFGAAIRADSVCDLGSCSRLVANRVGHYLMPALALISVSVTAGSSGCAR